MSPETPRTEAELPDTVPAEDRWLEPFARRHASPPGPRVLPELPAWEARFTVAAKRPPTPAEREQWYRSEVFILTEWAKDFFRKNPMFRSLLDQPGAIRFEDSADDSVIDARQGSGGGLINMAAEAPHVPPDASNGPDWSFVTNPERARQNASSGLTDHLSDRAGGRPDTRGSP
jgi:hypothetical protein